MHEAVEAARRFDVEGQAEDLGTTLVVRDDAAAVEIFVPSDSLRYTRWPGRRAESDGRAWMPDDDAAVQSAIEILRRLGLYDDDPQLLSVSHLELARADGPDGDPDVVTVAVQVNFGFEFGGLRVFGPGAKAQATLTPEHDLLECYRFWRRPREAAILEIIGLPEAIARVRADPAYAPLADDARVTFHEIRLGYLALPPRELQRYLLPVYAFRGTVSTQALERYDHTRYVIAVDISPSEVKRLRVAHHGARPVL